MSFTDDLDQFSDDGADVGTQPLLIAGDALLMQAVEPGYARANNKEELLSLFDNIFGDDVHPILRDAERNFSKDESLIIVVTPAYAGNAANEIHMENGNNSIDTELCLLRSAEGGDETPRQSLFIFAVKRDAPDTNFWVLGPDEQDAVTLGDDNLLQPYPPGHTMTARARPSKAPSEGAFLLDTSGAALQ